MALGRHSQRPVSDSWSGFVRDKQQIDPLIRRPQGSKPTARPPVDHWRAESDERCPIRPHSARHAGPGRTELRVPHLTRQARSRERSTGATTLRPQRRWQNHHSASGSGVPSSPEPPSRAYRPDLGRLCEPTSSRSSCPGPERPLTTGVMVRPRTTRTRMPHARGVIGHHRHYSRWRCGVAGRGWGLMRRWAASLSSCCGGGRVVGGGEWDVLVVVLSGVQAVVEAADESVEEVVLGGGVAIAAGFALVATPATAMSGGCATR